MEVPRGFTRCDECEGRGLEPDHVGWSCDGDCCPSCSGSGLVPTEKLREEASSVVWDAWWGDKREPWNLALMKRPYEVLDIYRDLADAVLRKVAEHIREER